jgi:hypothetical protein
MTILEIKFGDEGLRLLPEIQQIESVEILANLLAALKRVNSLEELRAIYNQSSGNQDTESNLTE